MKTIKRKPHIKKALKKVHEVKNLLNKVRFYFDEDSQIISLKYAKSSIEDIQEELECF